MRIVSLLASATEMVCALGAGDQLVGRSHECDNPDWVRGLPCCTTPAFDTKMSSRAIDTEVRRRLRIGEPLYHVDADLIASLQPDLLLTQQHCAVCAVTPQDVARSGTVCPEMMALSANSLADIDASIRTLAARLDRAEQAEAVIANEHARRAEIAARLADRPRPTVVVLEWTDPPFAMGNWGPEMVIAAGGTPLLAEANQYSRPVTWENVIAADPDHLIIAPCGYDLERSRAEHSVLSRFPGWPRIRAVRENRVTFADGNRYFNRSGMTVTDTIELLAGILHPAET